MTSPKTTKDNGAVPPLPMRRTKGATLMVLPVKKGDFGTKYRLLPPHGIDGVKNRAIKQDHVRKHAANLDSIEKLSTFVLVYEPEGGFYWICGGQHRFCAMNEFGTRTYWIEAKVWTRDLMTREGVTFADLIVKDNITSSHTRNDTLEAMSPASAWKASAEKFGVPVTSLGRRSTTKEFSWADIVMGHMIAGRMVINQRPTFDRNIGRSFPSRPVPTSIEDLFLHADSDAIDPTMEALSWWNVGHQVALTRKNNGFSSRIAIAFAIVAFHENKAKPSTRAAPVRLAESPHAEALRVSLSTSVKSAQINTLMFEVLDGLNYRVSSKARLTLFGQTGRE